MKNSLTWMRIIEVIVIVTVLVAFVLVFIDRADAIVTKMEGEFRERDVKINLLEISDAAQVEQYEQIIKLLDELIQLHPRQ